MAKEETLPRTHILYHAHRYQCSVCIYEQQQHYKLWNSPRLGIEKIGMPMCVHWLNVDDQMELYMKAPEIQQHSVIA